MKQTIRLNERELKHLISESVKRVLNEYQGEPDYSSSGKYYVAADVNSEYFNDYDEAYDYALKIVKKAMREDPNDWEEVHLMDNEEWQSIVIFDNSGIRDLENGTFIPW